MALANDNIDDAWFRGKPIEGILFRLNDAVSVIGGPHQGKGGAVISVSAMEPEPRYRVEDGVTGHDMDVRQADLELIARDSET